MSRKALARLLLLATVLVWGATFTLVKSALADASPLLFNLVRMALATVALAIVNRRQLRSLSAAHLRAGALAGLFLAAGYHLQTLGLSLTTPAKSAFVTGLVVVFVPSLTLFSRLRPAGTRRPGLPAAAGSILAFTGLFFLTVPAGTALMKINPGDLLTIFASLAFAAHLLTIGRYAAGMSAGLLATLQIGFCTLIMLAAQPLETPRFHLTPRLVVALLVCSLLATAAAFTIQSFAQQVLPPTQTVLLLVLEPVFGALTSLLVLHESLGPRVLCGAALVLAGIAVIELIPVVHSTEIPA